VRGGEKKGGVEERGWVDNRGEGRDRREGEILDKWGVDNGGWRGAESGVK